MSRYVNLDEILELFGTCSDEDMDARLNIQDAISEKIIEVVELPKWIPCEERLPEESGEYLVTYEWVGQSGTKYIEVEVTPFEHKRWNALRTETILAWMPLPEPWEGADDETD